MWMQIPYFCGQLAPCWDTGSQWALERAKSNLVNEYFLVGMNEQMGQFVEMLEVHVPHIFKVNWHDFNIKDTQDEVTYNFTRTLLKTVNVHAFLQITVL